MATNYFEFTVSRNSLLQALQHTRQAINRKNALPMLDNFVLTFSNTSQLIMTVHASNGEIWMTEDVVLDGTKGDMRPICVYHHYLLSAIKALDEQPLRFDVGEMQMTVHHKIGSFRLPLANCADEFLSLKAPNPDVEAKDCHSICYEAPALASILNRCSYAMAQDELRPVMNGVYFNLTEKYSDYAASDGHVLVRVRKEPMKYLIFGDKIAATSFIMPKRIAQILQRVLPKTGDVDIDYQEKLEKTEKKFIDDGNGGRMEEKTVTVHNAQCLITIDNNMTIAFTPTDGRYPNYCSVIPEHNQYEMLIDRRELTKSLDRLVLFANDSNKLVRMTISSDRLRLNASDNDFELEGNELLLCETNLDEPVTMKIGMKATTLSKTLKTMSTQKVAIHIQDSSRAVIVNPQPHPDNEELTYLIMPMLCCDD
jgi:DNA polymerase-3 subunit beta